MVPPAELVAYCRHAHLGNILYYVHGDLSCAADVGGALVENPDYNPYRTMAADLNKDGKVNATDASDISNTSIGISLIDQTTGTVHR